MKTYIKPGCHYLSGSPVVVRLYLWRLGMPKYVYNSINVGYKQKNGFLEISKIISMGKALCYCHNCGNTCITTKRKVVLEEKKSCGCMKSDRFKICPSCQSKQNHRSYKICISCGHKFYNNILSLSESNPELIQYFDEIKNGFSPSNILNNSTKKIWCKCKFGHSYQNTVYQFSKQKSGCPICSNRIVLSGFNDLQTKYKELANEFDVNKNKITPNQIVGGGKKKWWWKCKHGHSWYGNIENRTRGDGCPICSNKKVLKGFNDVATTHPEVLDEWIDNQDPSTMTFGSPRKIKWKCKKCGNIWNARLVKRTRDKRGCPKCHFSQLESLVSKFLDNNNIQYIAQYQFDDCQYKKALKFDFFIPKNNILIECQGIQHYPKKYIKSQFAKSRRHSKKDIQIIQKRDKIKKQYCKNNHITLLQIPYWEIDNIDNILQKELIYNA